LQFLPQDKVKSFAELTAKPVQLLFETEKAMGQSELYEKHMSLINMKVEMADLQSVSCFET
jgi:hypothetical protein